MKKILILMLVIALVISFSVFATGCKEEAPAEEEAVEETAVEDVAEETSESGTDEEITEEVVTIQFLQWWAAEAAKDSLDGLIAAFEAENPNIKVELVTVPFSEMKTQIVANHAAGTIADVVGLNPPWTREFVDLGILEPLDDYMANDSDFNKEDYFPASMAPIMGNTYLAPYNTLSFFLFYNKGMFEKAGLEVPKSWADIITAAEALTDANANKYGFTMSMNEGGPGNGSILTLYPLLYAANGRTLVDGKYTCQTPEMVEAMNFLKTLKDSGSLVPGENVKSGPMMVEEFSLSNVGMMITNNAHVSALAEKDPDLNYDIIPIPTVDGTGKPELRHHGWDIGLTLKGDNKEEAWKFISFLLRAENMQKAGVEMKKIPSMYGLEVPEGSLPIQLTVKKYLEEYDMVEELMAMPSSSASWSELTKAGVSVLIGVKTTDEALADCQTEWDKILGQ